MAVTDVTAKYLPAVSWLYDRIAADAVLNTVTGLLDRIQAAVTEGGCVLEVGCGGGQLAHRLVSETANTTVTGIDLSPEQIGRAIARRQLLPSEEANRLVFRTASALNLPFADNTFDAVISIASIKHWADRTKGVSEMTRVLKDGGLLLIAETDRGCYLSDAQRFARSTRLPRPLHLPYLWLFRTYIAGQGLDLGEARDTIAGQELTDTSIARIVGAPFLMITGKRRQRDRI
ncbi:class I SAM-dependent methyltransferase [Mycobacterium haemophilum]